MTIHGTPGSDELTGTRRRDVFHAGGGDDRITGVGKGDRVCAGGGMDVVVALHRGYSIAYIDLGAGDDRLRTTSPEVRGGPGDDTIVLLGRGSGQVKPGPGDDDVRIAHPSVSVHNNTCVVYSRARRPVTVNLRAGRARGQGHDRLRGVRCIQGSRHDDLLVGTRNNDSLDTGSGWDRVFAGAGRDLVLGGWRGGGTFVLGTGNDQAEFGYGADTVYGGPGHDAISGLQGPDRLFGGPGNDHLHGTLFCDTASSAGTGMFDSSGNEVYGGPGNDEVTGDRGDDTILGGPGFDRGYPGPPRSPGADVFSSVERLTRCF